MSGVTSIATSLIVRVAVARIVRIAQFVRDGFFGGAGANGTAESGMGQVQEWIRERYPGVLGWRVLL